MSVAHHLDRLQARIETLAENHSVPGMTGLSLEDTLTALTPQGRSKVAMWLERLRAESADPDEQAAAAHITRLAHRTWARRAV